MVSVTRTPQRPGTLIARALRTLVAREGPGRVCVAGSLAVDTVLPVVRLPRPGETVAAAGPVRRPGGTGTNRALAVARAGGLASLLGSVGDDPAGRALLATLSGHGVDVTTVRVVAGSPTAAAFLLVDRAGSCARVETPGAAAVRDGEWVAESSRVVAGSAALLLPLDLADDAAVAWTAAAAAAGVRVVVAGDGWRQPPSAVLAAADPIVLGPAAAAAILRQDDARPVSGEWADGLAAGDARTVSLAVRRLHDLRFPSVVLQLGPLGAVWSDATGTVRIPPVRVGVSDMTGVGDAFAGALAAGVAAGRGRRQVLARAVASGVAAMSHQGAQPWTL